MINNWKGMLFQGILFVLLGAFAIAQPWVIALSIEVLLGGVLIAFGLIQGFHALRSLREEGSVSLLISAAFALVAGILLFAYPLSGVLTLTLLLALYFLFDGFSRIFSAFELWKFNGSGWILFSGFISILLGALIWGQWPVSAAWVIGIYVGIYLLFVGFGLIMLAFAVKRGPVSQ